MTGQQQVRHAIWWIKQAQSEHCDVDRAARTYARTYPKRATQVLEEIGSWPANEPELAALQKVRLS